ncbi:hypothetical protein R1sor_006751 [Riccia sorocarpa]|uniref:Reverse transcriptase domain-containing protein n=1 Tax=Riccia sorocarpa TaxID=122646 RepID=A0ABD3HS51_9MARC
MLMRITGGNLSLLVTKEAPYIIAVEVDGTVRVCGGIVQENPPSWGLDRSDHWPGQELLNGLFASSASGTGVHVYVLDTVLRKVRDERERKRREEGDLAAEVHWRRERLDDETSAEEVAALHKLEQKLKDRDLQEVRMWKIPSREKWLNEDTAPSRYFFTKLRARWARDSLEALTTEDGSVTTDKSEISSEVHSFFQILYSVEDESVERVEAREEAVGLTQNKLSPEESSAVSRLPDMEEVKGVVFSMKTNKAPGGDGLTIEVVKLCWSFIADDCLRMVHTVWAKRRLLKSDLQAVIRLIHKGGDRKLLGNWRPISLMKLTYKIVTKLLANRVKIVLPTLVDMQQTGFVMGRRITDNVLSLKIGQEWAKWSNQKALFLKLDFIKAYDRVDYKYLGRTLEMMGFDRQFFNEGRIAGFQIEPGHTLVHKLFADDTGVCIEARQEIFTELLDILKRFELASGARINLTKSLIMPLGIEKVPDWAVQAGCVIAEEGVIFKYLGVVAGVNLPRNACSQEIVRRMKNRLFRWEHHLLSWEARIEGDVDEACCRSSRWQAGGVDTYGQIHVVWFAASKQLTLIQEECCLPSSLPITSLKRIWSVMGKDHPDFKQVEKVAREKGLKCLRDCGLDQGMVRTSWLQHFDTDDDVVDGDVGSIRAWLKTVRVQEIGLAEVDGWTWADGWTVGQTWSRPVKQWVKLQLDGPRDQSKLSDYWLTTEVSTQWDWRWKKLWNSQVLIKHKLWLWRLLQFGLPTLERAAKWQVSDGVCTFCHRDQETVEHLMWSCPRLRFRTQWIGEAVLGQGIGFPSFLQVLDMALDGGSTNPVPLLILSEHCKSSWLERNQAVFNEEISQKHPKAIISTVAAQTRAFEKRLSGSRLIEFVIKAHQDFSLFQRTLQVCVQGQLRARCIIQSPTSGALHTTQNRTADDSLSSFSSSSSGSSTSSDDSSSQGSE